jgi:hypothetical protein
MSDERIALRPPFWAYGDIPELLKRMTPALRASIWRKGIKANENILPESLLPEYSASLFRVTASLQQAGKLACIFCDSVVSESCALNSGEDLVARGLYAFDIPVTGGLPLNLRCNIDNFVIVLSVLEIGVGI